MHSLDTDIRYEWTFCVDEHRYALYQGNNSKHTLGSLFAMWLQDRGDVSNWENAALLGGIVHTYSDLSLPVIAVWLGIAPSMIWEINVPASAPPWKFTSPDGDMMTIDREIIYNENNS